MKHSKFLVSLLVFSIVTLVFALTPKANTVTPTPKLVEVQVTAFDLVDVTANGTLSLKPEASQKLSASVLSEAYKNLDTINRQVMSKELEPFSPNDSRLAATATVFKNQEGRIMPAAFGICYCSEGCCPKLSKICCSSGFLFFCWQYRTCK